MFLLRNWDHELDDNILNIIERDGKSLFYKLGEEIGVSRKTLNNHLHMMREQGIIEWLEKDQGFHAGKKRYLIITEKTKIEKKLGIYEGVRSNEEKKRLEHTKEIKTKKLLRLLFAMAAIGSAKYVPVSEAKPGDIALIDKKTGELGAYSIVVDEGISVEDAHKGRIMDKGKYIDDYTSEEIEKSIDALRQLKIPFPLIIHISESRFGFNPNYKNLRNFVLHCSAILNLVIYRMEKTWLAVRKVKSEEIEWYYSIYNKSKVINFFNTAKKLYFKDRKEFYEKFYNKPYTKKEIQKLAEKEIKEMDLGIKYQYKELRQKYLTESNKEYKELYPLYDLIIDITYPKFLQQLHRHSRI